MTLTALTPDGQKICSLTFATGLQIRKAHPILFSPYPDLKDKGVLVFPRQAAERVLHFFHQSSVERTEWATHPESFEHQQGKHKIAIALLTEFEIEPDSVRFEVPIPSIKRIADVAIVSKDGTPRFIAECQLSSITAEQLEKRTLDYREVGCDTRWYFGKAAATAGNQDWAASFLGFYGSLSFRSRIDTDRGKD